MKTNKFLFIVLILSVALFIYIPCHYFENNKNRTRTILGKMYGKQIIFPKNLKRFQYENNSQNFCSEELPLYLSKTSKIVIYFSSDMCIECNMDKIYSWKELEKGFPNVKFIYVLSCNNHNIEKIKCELNNYKDISNLYFDEEDCLLRLNPQVGTSPLLHVFALDQNNIVEIVGDPLYNTKLLQLYKEWYNKTVCYN